MISLYLLGIMIGIVAALIMNQTAFRGSFLRALRHGASQLPPSQP